MTDVSDSVPAPMVPADRILALADQWATAAGMFDKRYGKQSRTSIVRAHVKQLRALVDAADSPHIDETCEHDNDVDEFICDRCTPPVAPAAPVGEPPQQATDEQRAQRLSEIHDTEPLCRCGHTKINHVREKGMDTAQCVFLHGGELCKQYDPRVPVSDEAEAQLWLIRNSKTGEWFMGSVGDKDGIWAANIAMSVVYSSQTGPTYGLPEDGEWVGFRAARTEQA